MEKAYILVYLKMKNLYQKYGFLLKLIKLRLENLELKLMNRAMDIRISL